MPVYSQLIPSADFVQLSVEDMEEERQKVEANLKALGHELMKKCNPSIRIETVISTLPIIRAVHEVIAREHPYMTMIGNDNGPDESYISEQVIAIAKTSPVPVFIVPAKVKYKKIEKAVVAFDFEAISRLGALKLFHDPSKWLHPELMILNVDPWQKHKENTADLAGLTDLLEDYEYKVYYSDDKDIVHGILDFAEKHHTQLIVALPGKYSFFYNLTHRSITKALALNSHSALLILK